MCYSLCLWQWLGLFHYISACTQIYLCLYLYDYVVYVYVSINVVGSYSWMQYLQVFLRAKIYSTKINTFSTFYLWTYAE